MKLEEFVNSEVFVNYVKNNPVKPICISALGEVKSLDTENVESLSNIARKLKNAVKRIK
ncbi:MULTISPECIES: hypothetical protein [unclassified Lysinibacillus]|uniref:hypothetical protein n=1 Tax=unclassified Lysinibacillus TaxID=2636778 RepID=UPI002480442C|nr:hypothetical protein [Lysinibacillus sp. 1 U-2021]WGT37948.1 hypothetical protein QH639_19290 [Lysinibacillus sp. 1 U-2021]